MLKWIARFFCQHHRQGLYYIGGSETLPPPLKGEEEKAALAALEQGDEGAKQTLVEHNLRLVPEKTCSPPQARKGLRRAVFVTYRSSFG